MNKINQKLKQSKLWMKLIIIRFYRMTSKKEIMVKNRIDTKFVLVITKVGLNIKKIFLKILELGRYQGKMNLELVGLSIQIMENLIYIKNLKFNRILKTIQTSEK